MKSVVICVLLSACLRVFASSTPIDRNALVTRYTPTRNASNNQTPMQVGNGNFAFGADITGLQTFLPFAIMSSWGWKNDSLPPDRVSLETHGRLIPYNYDGDAEVQQWLISNPNRVNLGSVGLVFRDASSGTIRNVTESDLNEKFQVLDLWTGVMSSSFSYDGIPVNITTTCAQNTSAISITIDSVLLSPERNNGTTRLGVFLDFPWADGSQKFSDPFVGNFSSALWPNHTTTLLGDSDRGGIQAQIVHQMVNATFYTSVGSSTKINITRDQPIAHRYTILPQTSTTSLSLVVSYTDALQTEIVDSSEIMQSSVDAWEEYWTEDGFIDLLTGSTDSRADELQRRIILSRYLMRVNEAGDNPPQESGLVNNGWYGKFHMEEYFWHSAHWALWNNWDILRRSTGIYDSFLASSIVRAQDTQGYPSGARWPKMTSPDGHSSPGEINNLLIWEQPHPLVFAEYEYRAFPTRDTLEKWAEVVRETANFMSVFAWHNDSTEVFDLGPPMEIVAEDTTPNATINPAFELAYWRFGLGLAETWMEKLGEEVPKDWTIVKDNLAALPIENGTYAVYEGIEENFWTDPAYINDHPSLVGLHGWLPVTPGLNTTIAKLTAEKVWGSWNFSNCWGWDFPMLAMSAARNNDTEKAIEWLLDPLFQFDDVGMPIGGVRVPTPYFPAAGALLYTTAMMAQGWDGSEGLAPGFPQSGWNVRVEGISTAL
ncbi:Six-hairpin glycosidase-like protein [Rhodocollybia butyracea]|uniref:Six-hairpin glycosidase-like protein n=1 Tax=Rhodocollybia butyracea TaxID=206335 RepID=A0A9P5TVS6_9AGAR|nr:Six-hairpin glycosidase-like protein [Rhodocollybia butyracea]